MQAMYDLVGDWLDEIFDTQVVEISILYWAADVIWLKYTSNVASASWRSRSTIVGLRKHVLELGEPLSDQRGSVLDRLEEFGHLHLPPGGSRRSCVGRAAPARRRDDWT